MTVPTEVDVPENEPVLSLFGDAPVVKTAKKSGVDVPSRLAHHLVPKDAPAAERWAAFERFAELLRYPPYRFARTMAANPHNYTLRKWFRTDDDFILAVAYLRTYGYRHKWGGSWYVQIDVNEHFYWTMGNPIGNPTDPGVTILINRKRIAPNAAYDAIGGYYDELFRDPGQERYRRDVVAMIERVTGPMATRSVLDVGCGTGALLRCVTPGQYVGVDPSEKMLQELKHRHPSAAVVRTPLASFASGQKYDLVLSLFGSGSYLSDAELERIPLMLKPGGTAVTMFYAPGHKPDHYRKAKVAPAASIRAWHEGLMPGTVLPPLSSAPSPVMPEFVIVTTPAP